MPAANTPLQSTVPYVERWLSSGGGHTPATTSFYTRTYRPQSDSVPQALIVFVHGFADHVARYHGLLTLFAGKNIAVFAFDQRGFGKTANGPEDGKGTGYGKTSMVEQMKDINWAIDFAKLEFPNIPTFLMGHSMGGGEALNFGIREPTASRQLSGIIATSPLIKPTTPVSRVVLWLGATASLVLPHFSIPARVDPNHLCHDPVVIEEYNKDKLIKQQGTLRGIRDMLIEGENLLYIHYSKWPPNLPLLIVHGTDDMVTSVSASQEFHDKLPSHVDKRISLFQGGYHELQNEPGGVRERLADEIIQFVNEHLTISAPVPSRL
ncbi:alpha/beta-hydrolase [Fistulina hepatica ATCC 64428]|uniref:Alpha/beta-hydrolase n=1 Tax=Fistulina hepatica ATCC 64428 TaxID=1128425 RepID=A0A0D7A5B9_9AGAR|nr:alpha/beta-hydrolase [Fistulina hepatica ATCC 64428]